MEQKDTLLLWWHLNFKKVHKQTGRKNLFPGQPTAAINFPEKITIAQKFVPKNISILMRVREVQHFKIHCVPSRVSFPTIFLQSARKLG